MAWQTVAICDEHWKEEYGDVGMIRVQVIPDPCYRDGCPNFGNIYVRRDVNVNDQDSES